MSLRDTLSSAPLQSLKMYDIITTVRLFKAAPHKNHIMCGIAPKNAVIP